MEMPLADSDGVWEVSPSALRPPEAFHVLWKEKPPEVMEGLFQPCGDSAR